jgi:hypothetical protein
MKWNRLFLFCLGLSLAGAFAMKWIEPDLLYNNEPISIFGLEFFYPADKIIAIFSGIDATVKTILSYHLVFDFVFMAGVYPGIACLCMMAVEKRTEKLLKRILFWLAFLQMAAWAFDVVENYYLLKWLSNPVIGAEFGLYHIVVYSKWIIALLGIVISVSILITNLFRKKNLQS